MSDKKMDLIEVATTVETAAQVTVLARLIGTPVELTPEEIAGARSFYADNFFN